MRRGIWCFAFIFIMLTNGFAQTGSGSLSLDDLVRELKVALLQVSEATETQNLPNLESAVLEANTSMKVEANGTISLWVVEVGGGQNNEFASTVTLTLKPPPPGSSSNISAVHLADVLKEAILSGARAIHAAAQGNPPLIADKLEASVRFAVQRDASGKLSVKFPPFDASVGGHITGAEVQTITVTYKK
jgi:hypothetical protein